MDQSKSTLKWFKGDTKIEKKTINLRFQNKQKCTQKATYQGRMLKILIHNKSTLKVVSTDTITNNNSGPEKTHERTTTPKPNKNKATSKFY